MKFQIKKNKLFRDSFNCQEKKRRIYRYLLSNNKIFLHIRWQCYLAIVKLNSNSYSTKLKNFCFLTGKTRIFSKKFRMSRFTFRKLTLNGKIIDFY